MELVIWVLLVKAIELPKVPFHPKASFFRVVGYNCVCEITYENIT